MRGKLALSIECDLNMVGLLGTAVRAMCNDVLPADSADAVELSVIEAVTNVIKHGHNSGLTGRNGAQRIEVDVGINDAKVVIDVVDCAPPIPDAALEQASASRFDFDETDLASVPESGMGLALIKMNMDEVSYSTLDGKNRLTMTKAIPGPRLVEAE